MTKRKPNAFGIYLMVTVLLLIAAAVLALYTGAADTDWSDLIEALIGEGGGDYYLILRGIRFPRILGAFFVGSSLAVAGAIMQALTRNPLADPGLLGLTSGANIAVALVYALAPQSSYLLVSVACFVGAGLAMLFVYGLSNATRSGQSPLNLILIGAAVSFFFQAIADGIAIWFRISKDVSMWTSGGLMGVDWNILSITPVIGLALLLSLVFSGQLTVLSLGEETAISMGQRTNLIRTVLILLITLLAGSAVAIAGNLALIGLMIPHVVRKMVGQDYRKIIPLCITVGGTFMILADYIGRTVASPFEIPVVAIVSVIGVPFYVTIARKGGIKAVQ